MQLQHGFTAQLAPAALIRFRRIRKAIAKHNLPAFERRLDHLRNVLRARCEHQSHFRQRRKTLGRRVQQNTANFLAGCRPARLARFHDFMSGRAQNRRQLAHLRALAGSVQSFEGDEFSAPRHRRNDSSAGASMDAVPVRRARGLL